MIEVRSSWAAGDWQRAMVGRLQLLLDRTIRGDVTGLVYVQQFSGGDVAEGMCGRVHPGKVGDALRDLRLDLHHRHMESLRGGAS